MTPHATGPAHPAAVDSVSTRTHDEPFSVVGPWRHDPAAAGQVVFTTVHSGHDLRPEVAERMALTETARFREEDPFTDAIARGVGSGMIMHRSRFEVDLNRPRATAVYMEPAHCWGLDVWRQGRLDDAVAERSREVHDAWYAELGRRLDVLAARGPFVVFDVHSFNHRRDGADAAPAPQTGNPDVNVGTGSLDREPWIPVVDALMDSLAVRWSAGSAGAWTCARTCASGARTRRGGRTGATRTPRACSPWSSRRSSWTSGPVSRTPP